MSEVMKDKLSNSDKLYRPFLKWAGGKSQLIEPIMKAIERVIADGRELVYMEPFIGSRAVFMRVMEQYAAKVSKAIINDRNSDLMNTYRVIRDELPLLLGVPGRIAKTYQSSYDLAKKEELFYAARETFNTRMQDAVSQAAYLIFLNKTCYNGLYHVNSSNRFT